jgi:hypothetical protein
MGVQTGLKMQKPLLRAGRRQGLAKPDQPNLPVM